MSGPDIALSMWLLQLEAAAVTVTRALQEAAVPYLLLKGPVTSSWLYGSLDARAYGDVDLLVSPDAWDRAGSVLHALGYRDRHLAVLGAYRPDNERAWVRGSVTVDLHSRLAGVPARLAQDAFDLFASQRAPPGAARPLACRRWTSLPAASTWRCTPASRRTRSVRSQSWLSASIVAPAQPPGPSR